MRGAFNFNPDWLGSQRGRSISAALDKVALLFFNSLRELKQATLGCFMVMTFLNFSQGDWLFDIFMGVEIHD